jgi:hypothetical protein
MNGCREDLVAGVIGGCLGTAAMSAVMLAAQRAGLLGEQPPERITAVLLQSVGVRARGGVTQDTLAVALHVGFGTALGVPLGLLRRHLGQPRWAALVGVVYGGLVWAVSYKGWIPALHILPPPERDRPGRRVTMLVAHGVYGGLLGVVCAMAPARQRGKARRSAGQRGA